MHQPVQTPLALPSLQHPPPPSHATHLSLRGGNRSNVSNDIDDSSFDDVDIADSVRPPPSAFTAATAYDPHSRSPLQDYPAAPSRLDHQRSLTNTFFDNCRTTANLATSTLQQHTSKASFHSPTKSLASFIPSRSVIESTASQPKIRAGAKVISNWFNGSSGPVNLGIAAQSSAREDSDEEYDSEEDEDNTMIAGMWNRTPALTRSSTTNDTTPKASPAKSQTSIGVGKFAWLLNTQKNAVIPPPVPSPTYHDPDDELLNLNISQSLFPHGPVDPLDPSSFHDLLSVAEKLLSRYQTAYREVSSELADTRAEQSAQDDELDEADTRTRHLKMQLETVAARASEQDAEMRKLREDLAFERRARQEEEAARKRSLSLVKSSGSPLADSPRRRNRVSNSDVSIDSGFESDCETDATSIFSRAPSCMSPTDTVPSSAASVADAQLDTTPKGKKPLLLQRQSTYDKVRDGSVTLEQGGWGCANCEGGAYSAVWGRLAREREENSHLRTRVETLEEAVESALNVVDGPWGR
ncbi:hypothetical protein K505DRAFT_326666 [Melanomma pulvis-pyrius CBS 109.77]|uniref:Uncharacterized protein n=1 Tax=Melanomma pulvis-pyrius CBS 109.77 TaxID=1314802 RepID=A0A6A6X6Z1_9PLEO|nr:hypothetical protein K505DRAFT_326666 [Melanomma pulvis-pyrius CBS 109.77]